MTTGVLQPIILCIHLFARVEHHILVVLQGDCRTGGVIKTVSSAIVTHLTDPDHSVSKKDALRIVYRVPRNRSKMKQQVCSVCSEPVESHDKLDAKGTVYHINCFKCHKCGRNLKSNVSLELVFEIMNWSVNFNNERARLTLKLMRVSRDSSITSPVF
ncbi:uncharacterized protein DEA37_0004512 [Paragonimus westermani]|uniref:LIM zinc-binding domain-containing protein n=1 Tax=Paragonimus westermani TaxID=34504 RepID=A0A5J4NZI3_9TREM|nr:uncharacterized protein DEA37_0004512 [Paragonimus westermani]